MNIKHFICVTLAALVVVGFGDCIEVSVTECEAAKRDLQTKLQQDRDKVSSAEDQLSQLKDDFSLLNLDDLFYVSSSIQQTADTFADDVFLLSAIYNIQYDDYSFLYDRQQELYNAASSLGNFAFSLDEFRSELGGLDLQLDNIGQFVLSIDCNACSSCDGGGAGEGGGGGSGSCPCESAIDAATSVLESIDSELANIKQLLSYLQAIINDIAQIKSDLSDTKEYLLEDYDTKIDNILEAIKKIKGGSNLLYEDYTNATKFASQDSGSWSMLSKAFEINQGSGAYIIDYSAYKNLNWFSRIEYLLGEIAGKWSPTNGTSEADFDEGTKAKIEEVEGDTAWSDDEYETHKEGILDVIDSIKEFIEDINPFSGCFDSSTPPNAITIIPDVSVESDLIGNTFPSVTLDLNKAGDGQLTFLDVVNLCHNILTFLYFVGFALIDIFAIYKFIAFLIFVNGWYWKVYHSWVSTMFNGGGR